MTILNRFFTVTLALFALAACVEAEVRAKGGTEAGLTSADLERIAQLVDSAPRLKAFGGPDSRAEFGLAAGDQKLVRGFECRLDAGAWSACASPFSLLSQGEQDFEISVRAIFKDGQVSQSAEKIINPISGYRGLGSEVGVLAELPDGSIVAGGHFRAHHLRTLRSVLPLTAQGAEVPGAFAGTEAIEGIFDVLPLPDGSIVARTGSAYGGVAPLKGLIRILPDGRADAGFATRIDGNGAITDPVGEVLRQSDGKLLLVLKSSFQVATNSGRITKIVRVEENGTPDPSFSFQPATTLNVNLAALQSLDRLVLGGLSGTLLRLTATGAIDTTFAGLEAANFAEVGSETGCAEGQRLFALAVAPGDRVLIGGCFNRVRGATVSGGLTRLTANGALDASFIQTLGSPGLEVAPSVESIVFPPLVNNITVLPNERVIVGGRFNRAQDSVITNIVVLTSAGAVDLARSRALAKHALNPVTKAIGTRLFVRGSNYVLHSEGNFAPVGVYDSDISPLAGVNAKLARLASQGHVYDAASRPDGTLVFTSSQPLREALDVGVSTGIVKMSADGTYDPAFFANVGAGFMDGLEVGRVLAIAVHEGRRLLVGGDFDTYAGQHVVRGFIAIGFDGRIDEAFMARLGNRFPEQSVSSLSVDPADASIVVGGPTAFDGVKPNPSGLYRFEKDGTLDEAFGANSTAAGLRSPTRIYRLRDRTMLVTSSVPSVGLKKILIDGKADGAFNLKLGSGFAPGAPTAVLETKSGKILLGGTFAQFDGASTGPILRLNSDGSRDATFADFRGRSLSNSGIRSFAELADGRILAGGAIRYGAPNAWVGGLLLLTRDGVEPRAPAFGAGFDGRTALSADARNILPTADGGFVVGGRFRSFTGKDRNNILKLDRSLGLVSDFQGEGY